MTKKVATASRTKVINPVSRESTSGAGGHEHCCEHLMCSIPASEADELVEQLVENLKPLNMRRTRGLVALLMEMAIHHHPMTLLELGAKPNLSKLDQATIYRLMMKLEEAEIVRRFSFRGRSTHFQLLVRGHQHDYLICKSCEKITSVEVKLPLDGLQRSVTVSTGWHEIQAELEFYGICPACVKK
ncbi:Fur family transcriptional regulator [Verrucomicrobium spinosum]|uniref:Fur family transcriptional regulator n=1 Tax=Verrucomicrobium spinosum TaxID=2736 RepID=UPI0001745B3D|nr:transcriptional repressor [Verrucomicrobium spinosum]